MRISKRLFWHGHCALLTTALSASLFFASFSAFADYWSAAKAFRDKDYETAFSQFKELAELGHPDSQFALSTMYYNGYGVGKNLTLAYAWIRLAADAGHAKAKELEPQVRAQIGEESAFRSRGLLEKFSAPELSSRLLPKIIPNCDYQDIVAPTWDKFVLPGYPAALQMRGIQGFVLIDLTIAPDGTVRDTNIIDAFPRGAFEEETIRAILQSKFKPAMRNNQPVSGIFTTAVTYKLEHADQLVGPVEEYFDKIRQDAEAGVPAAQYMHGLRLAGYPEDKKPWSEAMPWLVKAAQAGLAEAQYHVGHSLLRGRGCEADALKGQEWLLLAAQQDYGEAQIELARLLLKNGPGYEPDKAIFWLERAVNNGNLKAKKYLASLLTASPIEQIRDAKRAEELIADVLQRYHDDVGAREILASALAVQGRFKDAIKVQSKAIKAATKLDWDTAPLQERLAAYKAKQQWHGDILIF